MFYRDLILTVDKAVRFEFMSNLLMKVHENFSRLECALAFPGWAPGAPNRLDTVDPFTHHADTGDVLRFVGADAATLEALPAVLELDTLLRQRVVLAMPVKPCPVGVAGAAFCRDRGAEDLGRRVRRASTPAEKDRLKEAVRARAHTLAYFNMAGKDGKSWRRMYIGKVPATSASAALQTNSFGFSTADKQCFLPDF